LFIHHTRRGQRAQTILKLGLAFHASATAAGGGGVEALLRALTAGREPILEPESQTRELLEPIGYVPPAEYEEAA